MTNNSHTKLELIQAQISFIPDGWELDSVGAALNIRNNFRKPISQEVRSTMQGEYPYYGPTRIQDYISEYEQDGVYALIGEDGDHFLKYSTMQQTQLISGKCTVNNHAHILESTSKCDSEWFYIFFKHRNITNFLSRQGAGRFKLNKATLEKLPMLVPPLSEQRKIAKILSTWDKAISATERLIDNSKQQKKALMQQLLNSKRRFIGHTKAWKKVHLRDIGKCITGLTYKPSDTADDGMLVLRSSNIQDGKLAFEDNVFVNTALNVKSKTQENDILVCVRNGSKHLIGKSTLIKGRAIGQAHGAFMTLFRGKYPLFVSQLFQSDEFFKQVNMNLGATINSINTSDLHKFKFSIPTDEDEIDAIASCLSNADKEIEILQKQLTDLKKEKKALMQQLLTGKRRVNVDEKEVA